MAEGDALSTATINVKAERVNSGLGVAEAAGRIGVSVSSLRRAEAGTVPSPPIAKAIADFYGYMVTDIWPLDDGGDR